MNKMKLARLRSKATDQAISQRAGFSFVWVLASLVLQTATLGFGKEASLMLAHQFTIFAMLKNPYYLVSMVCLGAQALTWQLALRAYPLSFAYLFMSEIYINILLISHFVFKESVSCGNIAGSVIIMVGIIVLTHQGKIGKEHA